MIFIFLHFIISKKAFKVNPNILNSIILYLEPRESVEIEVDGQLQTYLSNINKANGITIDIIANENIIFGPFDYHSHLDGIDFYTDFNYTNYKLSFMNDGDYLTYFALVFSENLETSLNIINQNFSSFEFPITKYRSNKFTFFYNDGLIFHEKKYSSIFFIVVPVLLGLVFLILLILGCKHFISNL